MARCLTDYFLAALGLRHDASEIAHGAGRHEQPRLAAEYFRRAVLQAIDRRVFDVDIVANLRLSHGPPHRRRGLRHGIAAQIDNLISHGVRAF